MVNLTSQYAWMCQDHAPVNGTPVTTGATALGNGTPVGTWHVQAKETDRTLTGPGYSDFVHFRVPFNGDFGFHDSPWQTMPYGDPGYTTQGSNGCVHLPAAAMQWLYTWVDTDTTVTIEA
jgi:lipoprotein-anchoring transpeptidase ErfK/SrfK